LTNPRGTERYILEEELNKWGVRTTMPPSEADSLRQGANLTEAPPTSTGPAAEGVSTKGSLPSYHDMVDEQAVIVPDKDEKLRANSPDRTRSGDWDGLEDETGATHSLNDDSDDESLR
jgi:hypothetical protein